MEHKDLDVESLEDVIDYLFHSCLQKRINLLYYQGCPNALFPDNIVGKQV